jgi:pyridoxal phosphate enzyme (YggS family)
VILSYEHAPVRYSKLKTRITAICNNLGAITPDILCVSKNHPWEAIEQLRYYGVTQFGENRAQEAKEKFHGKDLTGLDLHFIGHLQRNKVKMVVPLFSWIDSVDSMKLAVEIEKVAKDLDKPMNILFEVKTTNEPSKTGLESQSELYDLITYCQESPYLIPRGLMTIAPFTTDTSIVRASFSHLRQMFNSIQNQGLNSLWDTLSMGMSDDYEIAIEEGTTMIRIGTYIFGTRENPN